MKGRICCARKRFEETEDNHVIQIRTEMSQVDIVAQRDYEALRDDNFVSTLKFFIEYLRFQQHLLI